jgi:hypothetical protein
MRAPRRGVRRLLALALIVVGSREILQVGRARLLVVDLRRWPESLVLGSPGGHNYLHGQCVWVGGYSPKII